MADVVIATDENLAARSSTCSPYDGVKRQVVHQLGGC
jgi:hypothetical protein